MRDFIRRLFPKNPKYNSSTVTRMMGNKWANSEIVRMVVDRPVEFRLTVRSNVTGKITEVPSILITPHDLFSLHTREDGDPDVEFEEDEYLIWSNE